MGEVRPKDWEPLAESDPIPGDWEKVKEAAARYRRTASAITRSAKLLTDISTDEEGWKGKSGTEFRSRSTEVADNLRRAHGRYETAANALARYWPVLKQSQEDSLEARREARAAQEDIDEYTKKAAGAEDKEAEDHNKHGHYKDQHAGSAQKHREFGSPRPARLGQGGLRGDRWRVQRKHAQTRRRQEHGSRRRGRNT